jgi:hypothetical protein
MKHVRYCHVFVAPWPIITGSGLDLLTPCTTEQHRVSTNTRTFNVANWSHFNVANTNSVVRFEVFTAVTMKNAVLWDVAPCRCCVNRSFGWTYLHLQGGRWRWYVPPKRRFTQYLHGATSQKTAFFTDSILHFLSVCIILFTPCNYPATSMITYSPLPVTLIACSTFLQLDITQCSDLLFENV